MQKLLLLIAACAFNLAHAGDVKTIDEFDLGAYKGKVVYLDFWASWCKPCQKSFPWMNDLMKKYPADKFEVVTINLDSNEGDMQTFLDNVPADFTVFHDPSGTFAEKFKLPGMPTSFIIDSSGKPVKKHVGFFKAKIDAIEAEIEELL